MRRFRLRIDTLLVLIIALGVGFTALRESNDTWDGGVFTLAMGALLVSILLAIHGTGERRAFWLGFALFGVAYLGLTLVPPIESRLITAKLLAYIDSRSIPTGPGTFDDYNGSVDLYVANNLQPYAPYLDHFLQIGHSLFALIAAFVGGRLSGYLYGKNREPVQESANPLESTTNGSGG